MPARILADLVVVAHASFVAFVVLGLVVILIGGARGWRWVRNVPLRVVHLAAIGFVVVQTWAGLQCPLTSLENHLRAKAGETTYPGGFIAHWVHELLFIDAPGWVFTLIYTAFGAVVVTTLFLVPPRRTCS